MTLQETYNTVVKHLLDQGGPARKGDSCVYRAPDGRKCAVGCLIPDERYTPQIEGHGALAAYVFLGEPLETSQANLLTDLQCVHDCVEEDWPDGSEARSRLCTGLARLRARHLLSPLGPETEC